MKRIYLFLLIATLPINLFCQQDDEAELDSEIFYRWDSDTDDWVVKMRDVSTYDANGNRTEWIGYEWDSETNNWTGNWRYIRTYDTNGNQTEWSDYIWDSETNDWRGSKRFIRTYDTSGNWIENVTYAWDSDTNDWIGTRRWVTTYDANGNAIEFIAYKWDLDTNDWIGTGRNVYTYDANGNRIEFIAYEWDSDTDDWVVKMRDVSTYDANGNITERIDYEWDSVSNDWIGNWRYVTTYDANGNRIEYVTYEWDSITNDWIGTLRNVTTYDANGNMIEDVTYEWDTITNDWIGTNSGGRTVTTYDANGNWIEDVTYEWDTTTNDWMGFWRYVSTYDANGNRTEWIGYVWDSDSNDWIGNWRYEYLYDANGNQTEEIRYMSDYDNGWIGDRREVYTYDANGNRTESIVYDWAWTNEWIYTSKKEYYWSYDLVWDQVFSVDENCNEDSILATVITGSQYSLEQIQWSLIGGNADHLFTIDSIAGDILLSEPGILDYETTSSYSLSVEAQFEDTTGIITDTSAIMIFLRNVNDNAPVVSDTTFEISEDVSSVRVVGVISVSDADGDLNPLTLSIVSGNETDIFKDFPPSGVGLYLLRYDSIDYEKQPSYTLTIQVTDGTFTDEAIITINVIDVDETSVGNIESSDPLRLYPNPVFEELQIDVPDLLSDGFDIVIMDLSGSVLYQESGYIERIDLSSFGKGVYFITVKYEDFVTTRKIIKL